MSGIQDFINQATKTLGIDAKTAEEGAGGLLALVKKHAGAVDFGKLASAVPGADDLATKAGSPGGAGGGLGGLLGGIASKAEGLLGGAGGALGTLAKSGMSMEKARSFLDLFVKFLREKVPANVLQAVASKVPGLDALLK